MSLILACPNCQTRYKISTKLQGKKVKCKSCGKRFAASTGAKRAFGVSASQATQRSQEIDAHDLAREVRHQAAPVSTPTYRDPDPLRNHVVEDPGFGRPEGATPRVTGSAARLNSSPSAKNKSRFEDAIFELRSGGNIIDNFVIGIFAAAATGVAGLLVESTAVLAVIVAVLGFIFYLSYYLLFEGITGRTVGKYVTGTKVVNSNGGKASFVQIIGRTFCRLIPLDMFSFLFCNDKSRPIFWHDSIPDTRVIDLTGVRPPWMDVFWDICHFWGYFD